MIRGFEIGGSYYANACNGAGRFVTTVAGRAHGLPVFRAGDTLIAERVMTVEGREFALVRGLDDQLYGVSSAVKADLPGAAAVMAIAQLPWFGRIKRAARCFFCRTPKSEKL